jgi:phosphoribosylformimino-5-aminoimidazole carboxamide ribotide isomerase
LPAIDLRGGRVVRLVEGDFARETDYGDDPVGVAREFAAAGARTLHIVDLDGAREGSPAQLHTIAGIAAGVEGVRLEVAGGLRTEDDVSSAFGAGADRIVVGTSAVTEPAFVQRLIAQYGADRSVVALDVRGGLAVGQGWRTGAPGTDVANAMRAVADAGAKIFEVTAIDRDGRLEGPDVALLARLVALERGQVIASGGIRSLEDLRAVCDLGCTGAIVGRALYEGRIDLASAIIAMDDEREEPAARLRRGRTRP